MKFAHTRHNPIIYIEHRVTQTYADVYIISPQRFISFSFTRVLNSTKPRRRPQSSYENCLFQFLVRTVSAFLYFSLFFRFHSPYIAEMFRCCVETYSNRHAIVADKTFFSLPLANVRHVYLSHLLPFHGYAYVYKGTPLFSRVTLRIVDIQ